MEIIRTEVLVIGGGVAGLLSAIESSRAGRSVTVLSSSRVGRSGNTLVSGASLAMLGPESESADSPEFFCRDLVRSGCGINDPEQLRAFLDTCGSITGKLEEYGVRFHRYNGRRMVRRPGGHSAARYYTADLTGMSFSSRGLSLTLPLRSLARELGVRFLEDATALHLLGNPSGVTGAHCLDRRSGRQFSVFAGNTLLACGGGAGIFSHTNNTTDVCGDSFRLAYECGAALRDMEFVQFHPTMMYRPGRMTIGSALFGDGAYLLNQRGEEFMPRYCPEGNLATRDVMARAVQNEIMEGRGAPDCVFVNCSRIDRPLLHSKYPDIDRQLRKYGLDIETDNIPVAPAAHFYLGGICTDASGRTGIPHLYACGEAVGGLHGANRLAGAALAEACAGGLRVGRALGTEPGSTAELAAPEELLPSGAGTDWGALCREQRRFLWENAGVIRTDASLRRALEKCRETDELLSRKGWNSAGELSAYYRLLSVNLTARLLTECALLRRETRGAHYRSDYPETSPDWAGSFLCRRRADGEPEIFFRKTRTGSQEHKAASF